MSPQEQIGVGLAFSAFSFVARNRLTFLKRSKETIVNNQIIAPALIGLLGLGIGLIVNDIGNIHTSYVFYSLATPHLIEAVVNYVILEIKSK